MLFCRSVKFTILGFLLLALASCAAKKEEKAAEAAAPSTQEQTIYKIPVESLVEGQKLAKAASVYCDSGAECSPSVGLLSIAYDEKRAGQCTASLIADDIMITNSHCIPNDIKEVGASCKNRMWLNFVKDSRYESQLGCDKILAFSKKQGGPSRPDYAVVKLEKKSTRPYFQYSRAGFQNQEIVKLHKVNPIDQPSIRNPKNPFNQQLTKLPTKISGRLGTENCKAKYNTSEVQKFFDPYAQVGLFVDCKVIHGNSGGPIQAQDGSIRGVIFGFLNPDALEARTKNASNTKLEGKPEMLNLGTSLACLEDEYFGRAPAPCANFENRWEQRKKAIYEEMRVSLSVLYEEETKNADLQYKLVSWEPVLEAEGVETNTLAAGTEVSLTVNCIREDINSFTAMVDSPFWIIEENFSKYMDKKLSLARVSTDKIKMEIRKTGVNQYLVKTSDGKILEEKTVSLCQ